MNDFFNSPLYQNFNRVSMDDFMGLCQRFSKLGMSPDDIREGIQSACDFFNIPFPRMVQDLTNQPNGQTMFMNWDRGSYYDDVLCYNILQLKELSVDTKEAFSLVMTHECAHRIFQNMNFSGPNNGSWEQELACDFFMGVRAGLWNMDTSNVVMGLVRTEGSPSHPTGTLRAMIINFGKYRAVQMRDMGLPLNIQSLMNEYYGFMNANIQTIRNEQRRFIVF